MSRDYDAELTATREEVAAVLSGVTDGVLAGSIRLGDGAEAVSVDVPDELSLEIEVESDDDGVSVELEAEWPHPDEGEGVEAADEGPMTVAADGEPSDTASGDTPTGAADAAADTPIETADDAADAPVAAPPVPIGAADSGSLARFELFRDRAAEWRWRLRHRNGNIIATGGEGYTRKYDARKGLRSVVTNAPGARITEE